MLLLIAIPTIKILPLPDPQDGDTIVSTEESIHAESAEPLLEEDEHTPDHYSTAFDARPNLATSIARAVRKMIRLITGRRNFQVLLVSFFLTALASSDTKLLVQYISKRYEWTFAQAGYMLSAKAIVNFTLLAIIVPRVIKTSISSKAVHGSEVRLNYIGALLSILISVVGVLGIAMAFKFWMLLVGKIQYLTVVRILIFSPSSHYLRTRVRPACLYDVSCQISSHRAGKIGHSRL